MPQSECPKCGKSIEFESGKSQSEICECKYPTQIHISGLLEELVDVLKDEKSIQSHALSRAKDAKKCRQSSFPRRLRALIADLFFDQGRTNIERELGIRYDKKAAEEKVHLTEPQKSELNSKPRHQKRINVNFGTWKKSYPLFWRKYKNWYESEEFSTPKECAERITEVANSYWYRVHYVNKEKHYTVKRSSWPTWPGTRTVGWRKVGWTFGIIHAKEEIPNIFEQLIQQMESGNNCAIEILEKFPNMESAQSRYDLVIDPIDQQRKRSRSEQKRRCEEESEANPRVVHKGSQERGYQALKAKRNKNQTAEHIAAHPISKTCAKTCINREIVEQRDGSKICENCGTVYRNPGIKEQQISPKGNWNNTGIEKILMVGGKKIRLNNPKFKQIIRAEKHLKNGIEDFVKAMGSPHGLKKRLLDLTESLRNKIGREFRIRKIQGLEDEQRIIHSKLKEKQIRRL